MWLINMVNKLWCWLQHRSTIFCWGHHWFYMQNAVTAISVLPCRYFFWNDTFSARLAHCRKPFSAHEQRHTRTTYTMSWSSHHTCAYMAINIKNGLALTFLCTFIWSLLLLALTNTHNYNQKSYRTKSPRLNLIIHYDSHPSKAQSVIVYIQQCIWSRFCCLFSPCLLPMLYFFS